MLASGRPAQSSQQLFRTEQHENTAGSYMAVVPAVGLQKSTITSILLNSVIELMDPY